MVENGTYIKTKTIILRATITYTIISICQLKAMAYLHILQSIQTKVEVKLKEPTS